VKLFVVVAAITLAALAISDIAPAPDADADPGSYLGVAHGDPALAGFSDYALMWAGGHACVLPPDQVAAVAPGMPAVSAAIYRIAHHELCP
jgi:hypothetical protein